MAGPTDPDAAGCPEPVAELAARALEQVDRAVGMRLEFDSDTLPILDHYLRSVPDREASIVLLVSVSAGAYFGEVIRRRLGGTWDLTSGEPESWRLVLPTGLSFCPAGVVVEAILQEDVDDLGGRFDAPPKLRPHLEYALERMGEVSVETYYSLCGRLDTLEHIQDVLFAVAAALAKKQS